MYKLNFKIEKNYAIEVDGYYLDLHNDFDFNNMVYEAELNRLTLSWNKGNGNWVAPGSPEKVKIVFDNILLFKTKLVPGQNERSNRLTLSFVGYLHPEDIEEMDGSLDENEANDDYHIIFGFENGLSVKVYSEQVRCNKTN